jgi:Domain of unknown function(DUF2779)
MTSAALSRLSKSRFVKGWQCHKLLWWSVHEPDAPELVPDMVLLDRFDQGRQVLELARARFPGATLIPLGTEASRIEATRLAMDFGASAILEGAFRADGVFAAADVLLRESDGYRLIEVKSSTAIKEDHVADAALQTHVLRRSGVPVQRIEVMHLNKAFSYPSDGDLFAREDVTALVAAFLPGVAPMIAAQQASLAGPVPDVGIGLHCFEPRACPFHHRCWPDDPHHIATLYNNGPKRTCQYLEQGTRSVFEIPEGQNLPPAARRQLRALREDRLIVEPGLRRALDETLGDARLGFLDFETIQRAVPVWDGTGPWQQVVVQFSYHERQHATSSGRRPEKWEHRAYLAEGPDDPRPELVERLLEATRGAERIVMYTPFERTRINELARQVPVYAADLHALAGRLVDLHPLVRDYVYHPAFRGSFSLKAILHPLVPDLSYDDLAVVDGRVASVEIARLVFVAHVVDDRDRLRRDLLAYCERDTWALVLLVERLREIAE